MLDRHSKLNSSSARHSHEQLDEMNKAVYDPTESFPAPVYTRANSDSLFNDNRDWAPWEELCRFVDLMDTQRLQTGQSIKKATSNNNRFSYPNTFVSKQSVPHRNRNALRAKRTKSDFNFYPNVINYNGSNTYELKSVAHVERDNNGNDSEEYRLENRKSNERGVSDLNRDYDEYRKSEVNVERGQQCLQRQQQISKPNLVVNRETSLPSSYSTSQSHSADYIPTIYHRRHHSHQFPISHSTNPNKTPINGTVAANKQLPTDSSAYFERLSPSKRSQSINLEIINSKTGIDSSRSRSLINVDPQFPPLHLQFTLPSKNFHSQSHPHRRSVCITSKSLAQPAHEPSAVRRRHRSTIEFVPLNGVDSREDSKRLEELDKLIEVERLKRKLAKISFRPHSQHPSSIRSQRSAVETISNWTVAEPCAKNTSSIQRQSRRQLVRYPTTYGMLPSEVSDDRYKPDRPNLERSASIVSKYSCANDASVKCHCADERNLPRMNNANGTNVFALSTANMRYIDEDDDVSSRNTSSTHSMFAKRGQSNDHSSSSNTHSYHTSSPLNSSINSFDFTAPPYPYCATTMYPQQNGSDGLHLAIDQSTLPIDKSDSVINNSRNKCLYQKHNHQSLLVPISEQFHSYPTISGSTQSVYRADRKYKIDEGFTVTASSRGRLNARINRGNTNPFSNRYCCGRFHADIPTEKGNISRSCDGLNLQQSPTGCCRFRFDHSPAILHRCETETLNSINECCANTPQFESSLSTSNTTLSRIQNAFERVLKRATSSVTNQQSPPYLSMNNLIINENNTETCFEPIDDGTESLDRRGWQQRALGRAGGQNGSTHNLMNVSAINGSNALYQEGPGVAIVDGPTTPQRLANFFARPFRTNPLKRTKSSSKLDRKRASNDPEYTASRPDLQRSQENVCTLGSSSIYGNRWPLGGGFGAQPSLNDHNPLRSSRSHESLLSYSTTSHMIDMGAPDLRVQPIHPSVLDVPNCFKVANTYYACRTPHERNRWIENLRRTMNPHRDEIRRTENALEIWILEAKGVPMKRRYYCEICLDKTLVGRTSAKPRADICFWGEHFDYSPIPKVDDLCINLYRDADPKKKKDRSTLIGYVQIKIDQLAARHPVERWYTVTASSDGSKLPGLGKDKGETAAIRVKARYQSVDILPMYMYDDLVRFLRLHYLSLCLALEPLLGVKAKEDCATAMVRIMHKQRLAKEFLCDLIMSEVDVLDNEHLMFRGNSLATKAMEAYMKIVADEYLKETLGDFVKSVLESKESCEVDPLKMVGCNHTILERNRQHLTFDVQAAWGKIVNSTTSFPFELRDIFDSLRRRLEKADRHDLADTLISSSIFLRFLCPAILSPSLFNLVSEYPSGPAARNLTLIAKTLQTLANFTKFGGKEHYMEFMNEFVSREWDNMHQYLMRISTAPPRTDKQSVTTNDPESYNIDLGKEISLLHAYLDEIWTQQVHEKVIAQDHSLEDLRKILIKLGMRRQGGSESCSDMHEYDSRNAQSPASDYDNTGLLKSRNHNVPAYPYVRGIGQAQVMSRSTPASHLNTNDDYVLDIALLNDSFAMRQAGICVQQHRSAQHKNRQPVDSSPKERTKPRNSSAVPATQLNGECHSLASVYQNCDNVASGVATTSSSNVSRVSPKSFNTALTNRHTENDTDSDDEDGLISQQMRHARPPRKGKRRVVNGSSQSRHETPTRTATTVVASQPPSSGYQSQNHSSSLSSSNSSSPVERSNPVNGVECTSSSQSAAALKIVNKMFTQHSAVPSTSYHPSQSQNFDQHSPKNDHFNLDTSAPAAATKTSPNINSTQCYRSSAQPTTSETATVPDVTKCSLPRTNPRYSGRSSYGTAANIGVVKPTLIDVGNDNDISTATAMPVRSGDLVNESSGDLKQYDDVWAVTEHRTNAPNRWKSTQSVEVNVQQNQQEIIEQQKREILRLLKENEELKKHVASSQQNSNSTHISIAHENVDVQPFADSGASEDSYDSLSSFSDHTASLPQKAATHC